MIHLMLAQLWKNHYHLLFLIGNSSINKPFSIAFNSYAKLPGGRLQTELSEKAMEKKRDL
jgi:hypothetical protein